jgi:hypothetical protein
MQEPISYGFFRFDMGSCASFFNDHASLLNGCNDATLLKLGVPPSFGGFDDSVLNRICSSRDPGNFFPIYKSVWQLFLVSQLLLLGRFSCCIVCHNELVCSSAVHNFLFVLMFQYTWFCV